MHHLPSVGGLFWYCSYNLCTHAWRVHESDQKPNQWSLQSKQKCTTVSCLWAHKPALYGESNVHYNCGRAGYLWFKNLPFVAILMNMLR